MLEESKMSELDDEDLINVTGGTGESTGTINIIVRETRGKEFYYCVNPQMTICDLKKKYLSEYQAKINVRIVYS